MIRGQDLLRVHGLVCRLKSSPACRMACRPIKMATRSCAMQFTNAELETLRSGSLMQLQEGDTALVVLRADVFDRLRALVYDDDAWTDEEMALLAGEDANSLGWE